MTPQVDAFQVLDEIATSMPCVNGGKLFGEIADYRSKQKLFHKPYIWNAVKHTTPSTWWSGLCGSTELSKIASQILNLPPTSAAVERSFSRHSHVHSAKRNRLTAERAGKLVYIGHNLQLIDDADNEPAALPSASEKWPRLLTTAGLNQEHQNESDSDTDSHMDMDDVHDPDGDQQEDTLPSLGDTVISDSDSE